MLSRMTQLKKRRMTVWWIVAGVIAFVVIGQCALTISSWRRPELGVVEGVLRPCPTSPNCVCSEAHTTDGEHEIAPLSIAGDPTEEMARLQQQLMSWRGATLIDSSATYLRYEFVTPLVRYVDDVEFRLDAGAGVIHVRSASRVGHSDLGANRKRVEAIRTAFTAGD